MSRVGTVDCPLCKKNPAEVVDTSKGLLVEACRDCNYKYSYSYKKYGGYDGYPDYKGTKYNKFDPGYEYSKDMLERDREMYASAFKSEPIQVDPKHLEQLKEQTALTAALNAEKKIAEERNKAERERQNMLKLLKETGLDQSLD